MPTESTKPTGRTYLTARNVRRRYGVSDMSLWRWLRDPALGFPQPLRIRNRRYWDLGQLETWDARRAGATVVLTADATSTDRVSGASDIGQVAAAHAGLAALVELARSAEGRDLLLRLVEDAGEGKGVGKRPATNGRAIGGAAVPGGIAILAGPPKQPAIEVSPKDQAPCVLSRTRRGRGLPR